MSLGSEARLRTPSLRSLTVYRRSDTGTDDSLVSSGLVARSPLPNRSPRNASPSAPPGLERRSQESCPHAISQHGARCDRTVPVNRHDVPNDARDDYSGRSNLLFRWIKSGGIVSRVGGLAPGSRYNSSNLLT
jgi:hypothetical protein